MATVAIDASEIRKLAVKSQLLQRRVDTANSRIAESESIQFSSSAPSSLSESGHISSDIAGPRTERARDATAVPDFSPESIERFNGREAAPSGLPYVNPHMNKGAIIVRGGKNNLLTLNFSRYPTTYSASLTPNVGRATIPGATTEAFQKLGSKATEYKMKVLFHDAWLGRNATHAGEAFNMLVQVVKSYWAYDIYWQTGKKNGDLKKIIFTSIEAAASDFKGVADGSRLIPGRDGQWLRTSHERKQDEPQVLDVDLSFVLDEGIETIVPFKPRKGRGSDAGMGGASYGLGYFDESLPGNEGWQTSASEAMSIPYTSMGRIGSGIWSENPESEYVDPWYFPEPLPQRQHVSGGFQMSRRR